MKTTTPTFENLKKALQKESDARLSEFIKGLKEEKDLNIMMGKWYYNTLLPKKHKGFTDIKEAKEYITQRKTNDLNKSLQKEFAHIDLIAQAPEFTKVIINVEWKRNRTWGSNPSAEARVQYDNGQCEYFNSGSISGCGYDKGSTAVARALNQSNSLLKALYILKDKNIKKGNRELFGYGSGYGILPNIEGGVGVSCYPAIFNKIGFEYKGISNGKSFDVYEISKISK